MAKTSSAGSVTSYANIIVADAAALSATFSPLSATSPEPETYSKPLLDREGRAIAELLTRFKNLIQLAAMPKDGAILEQAAAQSLQIETESQALVCIRHSRRWLELKLILHIL